MNAFLRSMCLLLLCFPSIAAADAPTPQSIVAVERMLGLDVTIDYVLAKLFETDASFEVFPPGQRKCLLDSLTENAHADMRQSIGSMFGDDATAVAWIAFAKTPGGSKVLGAMRDMTIAQVKGQPVPDMAAVEAGLGAAERQDIAAFMQTPAAEVMQKKFPSFGSADQDAAAVEVAAQNCGIVRK
ncbi:hypothetical protein ACFQZQ_02425 [Lysobacter koreensis]|uniref:DUF2059 domain-containing protein n=1 Tax=Lysobacter koreensis TaxID=266122 RepID=A0ABW2YI78_9GAMM